MPTFWPINMKKFSQLQFIIISDRFLPVWAVTMRINKKLFHYIITANRSKPYLSMRTNYLSIHDICTWNRFFLVMSCLFLILDCDIIVLIFHFSFRLSHSYDLWVYELSYINFSRNWRRWSCSFNERSKIIFWRWFIWKSR